MFTKLLVPLDRSTLAEHAIGRAVAIARECRAELELVVVHEPGPFSGIANVPWGDPDQAADQRYIESLAAEVMSTSSPALRVTSSALRGTAAGMICQHAKTTGADLIVMTSHGRTGLSRAWLGSVTDAVVRECTAPVLVLRAADSDGTRLEVPDGFKHVLVPLDGSALAMDIIPMAAALAQASRARVTLLRVVHAVPMIIPYDVTLPAGYAAAIEDVDSTKRVARDALEELTKLAKRMHDEHDLTVQVHVETDERVATTIVDFANGHGVDVVAMSTHGRGITRWLLGSVADKVLRSSDLPVLLRRPVAVGEQAPLIQESKVSKPLPAVASAESANPNDPPG
jgi:nucleotide-binding universal stress UspA family protein